MILEAHEEFVQQIENTSRRMMVLSLTTIFVSAALAIAYTYQLALALLTGVRTVTVEIGDPVLDGLILLLLAFVVLWFYVGLSDLLFTKRMFEAIREARMAEREIEKRIAG